MPIPPPERYAPSNLTKKQQQEQLAACYGVTMPTAEQPLSELEVAHMRKILAQHDSAAPKVKIHDLNNPPKDPYRFQRFPLTVYDLKNSHPAQDKQQPKANSLGHETVHVPAKVISRIVQSEGELEDALAAGWSEAAPSFGAEPDNSLDPKWAGEARRVQAVIDATRQDAVSPLDAMTKAELVALAKEIGCDINPADKKEVILAALKAPDTVAA